MLLAKTVEFEISSNICLNSSSLMSTFVNRCSIKFLMVVIACSNIKLSGFKLSTINLLNSFFISFL